jgi:hypothetical protein
MRRTVHIGVDAGPARFQQRSRLVWLAKRGVIVVDDTAAIL